MSEKLQTALRQVKEALDQSPKTTAPFGHHIDLQGDVNTIFHCVSFAYEKISGGDYTSKQLHLHLGLAYQHAAALFGTEDGPQPVGGINWLQIILLLIQVLGEEQLIEEIRE